MTQSSASTIIIVSNMPPAELRDRAEIRTAHPGHRHEVHPVLAGPPQLTRRIHPAAVPMA
jgi:hypothetical protein